MLSEDGRGDSPRGPGPGALMVHMQQIVEHLCRVHSPRRFSKSLLLVASPSCFSKLASLF